MKIAIITGASSGIGKEFLLQLSKHGSYDEVWVIARNAQKLEELKGQTPFSLRVLPLDLGKEESLSAFRDELEKTKPEIAFLANCSGFGVFQATEKIPLSDTLGMIDLNCRALTALTLYALPYMTKGGEIVEIASVAAFQPIPYINVYGASKAYVLSFSRALHQELKGRVRVIAVCPFWTKTAFFDRADLSKKGEEPVVKKYVAMYDPKKVVARAYRDLSRGKDVSKYGFIARIQAMLCKLLPHSLVMKAWMSQQKLKPVR